MEVSCEYEIYNSLRVLTKSLNHRSSKVKEVKIRKLKSDHRYSGKFQYFTDDVKVCNVIVRSRKSFVSLFPTSLLAPSLDLFFFRKRTGVET